MTLYVTEHAGIANRREVIVTPTPIAAYSLSSASTYPFPSAGAQFLRVSADVGMLLGLLSTSTATTLTSTNAFRVPPNAPPELFSVSTTCRVIAQST